MKKFAAILLLFIFLFNLVGYRFVFNYAQQQSDIQLASTLDKNQYNDADLITINVPLSMPYQTMQSGFERVTGEITIKGKIYKYVKRKVVDGEMVLMCLPDNNKMSIQTAKEDFFKTTNDIAQNNTSKKTDSSKTGLAKNIASEYDHQINSYSIAQLSEIENCNALSQSDRLLTSPHMPPVQPPDML